MAAVAISYSLSGSVINAAGLLMGVILLLLSVMKMTTAFSAGHHLLESHFPANADLR